MLLRPPSTDNTMSCEIENLACEPKERYLNPTLFTAIKRVKLSWMSYAALLDFWHVKGEKSHRGVCPLGGFPLTANKG